MEAHQAQLLPKQQQPERQQPRPARNPDQVEVIPAHRLVQLLKQQQQVMKSSQSFNDKSY